MIPYLKCIVLVLLQLYVKVLLQLYVKLHNSVSGIEPIVWKQAKLDNPHPDKLIPTPLIGFQELSRRTKCQEYETKQHQQRLDVILVILFLLIHLRWYFKLCDSLNL